MSDQAPNPTSEHSLSAQKDWMERSHFQEQIEENRLKRVPSYCFICATGWGCFGIFYWFREATYSAMLCLPIAMILVFVGVSGIRNRSQLKRYANLHLGISALGLFLETLISGLSASSTIPFLSCIGVIAVHQSGLRSAAVWTVIASMAVAVLHFALDPGDWPLLRSGSVVDDYVAFAGFFILISCMAAQGEWFATKYFQQILKNAIELSHRAEHDQLTQLANRYRFRQDLEQAQVKYLEKATPVGLLMLDLDGFKEVNDRLGHTAGDAVLIEVANRLKSIGGDKYVVARIGGDEFTVLVNSSVDRTLEEIASEIIEAVKQPIKFDGEEISIAISIGAASLPEDTVCVGELQAFADVAANSVKGTEESFSLYTPQMSENNERKRYLIGKLAKALEQDEFSLVYQPQVDVAYGRILGVEALLRWKTQDENGDPEFISPVEFIPVLESTGKINQVGRWVLEQACDQSRNWLDMGIECCVSVNVSPVQFRSAQFFDDVVAVLARTEIPPRCVDLEITEGVMLDRLEETSALLDSLKEIGVSISVDDFGTGYSSLAYLKHLSIDRLKIDRVFIKDIPALDDGSIAESIVALAKTLDLCVLAEGVETTEQLEFLSEIHCDAYQGYHFSKPINAAECTALLLNCGPFVQSASKLEYNSLSS